MAFERDRLAGLLALQLGFISRDRLLDCLAAWSREAGRPLAPILRECGGMSEARVAAIEAMAGTLLSAEGTPVLPDAPADVREAFARIAVPDSRGATLTVLAPPHPAPPPAPLPRSPSERYVLGEELGRGGLGRVVEAFDAGLKREVAVKLVLDDLPPALAERFVREAELTARLEHPNIVPVHDFGSFPGAGGGLFLCMKRVRGRDLGKLLRAIEARESGVADGWTRARLLRVFQEICLGVAFAHSRGVIHRDLKPANVMIGDYGETLIVDWGLARLLGEGGSDHAIGNVRGADAARGDPATALTLEGEVLGTPAYMPPEQADGRLSELDERSDVYSLGAILYEILTFRPPFEGRTPYEILEKVQSGHVRPPSSRVDRGTVRVDRLAAPPTRAALEPVPQELEVICLKALAFERDDRYRTARELHDEIQLFLEGVKEREREHAAAEARVARGREAIEKHGRRRDEARAAAEETKRLGKGLQPHQDKTALWASEDLEARLRREAVEAFAEANAELTLALGHERQHAAARRLRASLFWEKFLEAEAAGDAKEMLLARRMVEGDNDGAFDALLKGDGSLSLRARAWPCRCLLIGRETAPDQLAHAGFHPFSGRALDGHAGGEGLPEFEPAGPVRLKVHGPACAQEDVEGADVWLWRFEDVGRLSVPVTPPDAADGPAPPPSLSTPGSPFAPRGPGRWLGKTPLVNLSLPMGSYLLAIAREGFEAIRFPVTLSRCGAAEQDVTLWRRGELPEGYLPIAGGSFGAQGDTEDPHSGPAAILSVDDVFLARHPVTCREYAEFLNALADSREAARRAPRESSDSGPYWPSSPFEVPTAAWLASAAPERRAKARRLQGSAADWEEDWPVLGVSWEDAMAYASWRRGREGRCFTLPHEEEWEKAARGTDRRHYPWGNYFDGRWCNHTRAHPGAMHPVSVEAFPHDESPYGIRGLAGNGRDLCLNDPGSEYLGWRVVRGGNWSSSSVNVRAAMRSGYTTKAVYQSLGFRLACLCRLPG